MASIQKGTVGVVWSVGDTAFTGTGVPAAYKIQGTNYTLGSQQKRILGADSIPATRVFYDAMERLTLDVTPTGATLAAAKGNNILPAIGADITLTSTHDTEFAGTYEWHFVGGTKRMTVDGEAVLTMELERDEVDLTTIAAA